MSGTRPQWPDTARRQLSGQTVVAPGRTARTQAAGDSEGTQRPRRGGGGGQRSPSERPHRGCGGLDPVGGRGASLVSSEDTGHYWPQGNYI